MIKQIFHNKQGISLLPILLIVLGLSLVGGGGYYWYANYYVTAEPIVIVDDDANQPSDDSVMEEKEQVDFVFPDDYFLSKDELTENFELGESYSGEINGMSDMEDAYKDAKLDDVIEYWAGQYSTTENNNISVVALLFGSTESLEKEVVKIAAHDTTASLGNNDQAAFIKHDNVLIVIVNESMNDDGSFQKIIDLYEQKLDTQTINILSGEGLSKSNVASIKANLAALPAAGEVYYDDNSNSYAGFCEIYGIRGVIDNINSISEFNCFDEESAWAASGKLLESETYWCIDSTGIQLETVKGLVGTNCQEDIVADEELPVIDKNTLYCFTLMNAYGIMAYYPNTDIKDENKAIVDDFLLNYNDEEKEQLFEAECTSKKDYKNIFDQMDELLYVDEDKDGLNAVFEIFYGSSDNNKDTDGDGYDDLTEVENGYSPIE